jgi:excinuclease ATPase subunit
LVDLQTAAKNAGKNSVVNIQGNYKDKLLDSKDKFQCVVGNMATAVALKANLK